ncbi:MAG: type II secretion system ATPase GspE [Thermodesulfobacteriota bacterium]|nr:type II secretion system ATPase GspE [Thermodesulfobacteriota bacterium]
MSTEFLEILKNIPDITAQQAEKIQRLAESGRPNIGELLVRRKIITENQLLSAWAVLYGIPFEEDVMAEEALRELVMAVPAAFLKKFGMVPVKRINTPDNGDAPVCRIAINDPSRLNPLDDLVRLLGVADYSLVLTTREAILTSIAYLYDTGESSAEALVRDMESTEDIIEEIDQTADLLDDASDAPIIKLVNHIVSQSVKAQASDIHIEAYQDSFKIRYRVDGILYDFLTPPKRIQPALVSRIKVMADMNIAEKRLPQDGRLQVRIGDQEIDIRVSSIPITAGERLVLRLLNKSGAMLELQELGLPDEKYQLFSRLIHYANGIILVTGPTGSGKTTTLYGALSTINKPDINIITIEDPVEYQINGINQIHVNQKIGLTFARGLRSIVRQDPDVILIGEIRDKETAEIAVQSALTGHLVFSTLHTNDSASAITRLVDIGVEPFLISSSVIAVVAQRLVRVLCPHCKQPYAPDEEAIKSINAAPALFEGKTIYRRMGCTKCLNTGYSGRVGIFEIMVLDETIKKMILTTHDSGRIEAAAIRQGMRTLRDDGVRKILAGVTSIAEVLRVTQR